MGGHVDERFINVELLRVGVCGAARVLAHSLRGGPTGTFLFSPGQSSSRAPYSSCLAAVGGGNDFVLEFLRLGERDQCAVDDSNPGAIHRSNFRRDVVATAATESATAL